MSAPAGRLRRRTPTFTQDTLPAALQRAHRVRAGVEGQVVVESGSVDLVFDDDGRRVTLDPERPGRLPPQVEHHLVLTGPVRLSVAFYDLPATPAPDGPAR